MCTDLQNNNQWWEFPLKRAHWINTINTGLVCEIMALKIRKHSPVHLNAWTTLSCTPKTRQKTKLKSCAECKMYRSWKNLLLWGEAHTLFQAVKGRGGGKWKTANICRTFHPFTSPPPNTPQSSSCKMTVSTQNYRETRIEFRSLTFEKFREVPRNFRGFRSAVLRDDSTYLRASVNTL